jgi:hypothetical protein
LKGKREALERSCSDSDRGETVERLGESGDEVDKWVGGLESGIQAISAEARVQDAIGGERRAYPELWLSLRGEDEVMKGDVEDASRLDALLLQRHVVDLKERGREGAREKAIQTGQRTRLIGDVGQSRRYL